jgi:DNA-binding beta-propeller fold protein YncE
MGPYSFVRGLTLTLDQTQVVVTEQNKKRLVMLDAVDGRPVSDLTPPAGVLPQPMCVVIVPHTGQVLVTDYIRHQALLFDSLHSPEIIRTFGAGYGNGDHQLSYPCGIAVVTATDVDPAVDPANAVPAPVASDADGSLVVIAEMGNNRVTFYRLHDASFIRHFGSQGSAPGQFHGPHGLAVVPSFCTPHDRNGWLAVADDTNCRVQVLTQLGQVVRVLQADAANGLAPLCNLLLGLTVCQGADGQAEILVADSSNHRVVAFALDGSAARVVCDTHQEGSDAYTGHAQLSMPGELVVSASGNLWVADLSHSCVHLFH